MTLRGTPAGGSRGGFAGRTAQAWLTASGIDDQLGAAAVFAASARPAHQGPGWVLADLADPIEAPARPVRLLVGVGSRAVYGFPIPRWRRAPIGLAFALDSAVTFADPPLRRRPSELVLHDQLSAQMIRLTGVGVRRADIQATITAVRALLARPGTGPVPSP